MGDDQLIRIVENEFKVYLPVFLQLLKILSQYRMQAGVLPRLWTGKHVTSFGEIKFAIPESYLWLLIGVTSENGI